MFPFFVRQFMAVMLSIMSLLYGASAVPNPVEPISPDADLRVVSFNLRCTGMGKTSVAYRAPLMTAQLLETDADTMGFQEANLRWMTYLEDNLSGYAYVGVARTNGRNLGEFSPIFYKKDKFDLQDSGTFWLSKTPDKAGTKDWGSKNIRICTWAILKNKETGLVFAHFNTHLDHVSALAREEQMQVLLGKIAEYAEGLPVVLTGDFNDTADSAMYRAVSEVLQDVRTIAPVTDNQGTFHNYGAKNPPETIDFIFVSDGVVPLVYHVMDDKINNDYLSDHFGLYTDIKM